MSPLDKTGNFHLHPGAARMHDSAPKAPPIGKPGGKSITEQPGGGEAKGHVELHHGPPPDGSMPNAKFHTIHHGGASGGGGGAMGMSHEGGETKGHETLHEAHHAMNEHMGEDGCSDGNCAEHGDSAPEGAAEAGMGGGADDEY